MKRRIAIGLFLVMAAFLSWFAFHPSPSPTAPVSVPVSAPVPISVPDLPAEKPPLSNAADLEKTKEEMMAQLNETEDGQRTLELPPLPKQPKPHLQPVPTAAVTADPRALGRKKREGLPLGVVIWDNVRATGSPGSKEPLYMMATGDMLRVFPDQAKDFYHVQPGLDVFLAATTKEVKPAGERLPDRDVWVKKSDMHLFEPDDAKEYILETAPVTLGNDDSFSTLGFYERAMKNPDPVVHRVVGPRLIALVLLHEDYSTSWSKLYRDGDQKIRDAALSALNVRGVNGNREIIEDLIVRLTELTQTRAQGETELEVLSILNVLKQSHHPRVPAALASFKESWQETQGKKVNAALMEILQPAN